MNNKIGFLIHFHQDGYLLTTSIHNDKIEITDHNDSQMIKVYQGTIKELAKLIRQHEELSQKAEL